MMFDRHWMSLMALALPLGAGLLVGLLGKNLGLKISHRITIVAVGISFFLSLFLLKKSYVDHAPDLNFTLYTWAQSGDAHFKIGFLIDRLSVFMMSVVSFVSWMVHIYTVGYMRQDPGYKRFFSYISIFTFGMLLLVMSNNFVQLFFGWEMVGLMSYLLIGFWFQRKRAIRANLKAFIVNRVGDFGFILGIAAVFYCFGSLDYAYVFQQVPNIAAQQAVAISQTLALPAITVICLTLFLGAMGKSAQIPLHVWLPDSMEGPTPISALIHAATMVTAGVFMLARFSPLFEYSELALNIILVVGALTCFLMGLVAVVENDIKRIIAYSTLSQLGYMMTAMGASAYPIGIFHLGTHAFFKALLFLCAGSVILALHHEQNIWKMGNLKKYMPITYLSLVIASLAMVGFPLFSGFYSKDLIIEAVGLSTLAAAPFAYVIVLGAVFITALYSFRLIFVVFHTQERMEPELRMHLKESPWIILIPLLILALLSGISGAIAVGPILENFFKGSLFMRPAHLGFAQLQAGFQGVLNMTMHGFQSVPFFLALLGIVTAWLFYVRYPGVPGFLQDKLKFLHWVLRNKYGFDAFNQCILSAGVRGGGRIFWHLGDQWLIDGVGVNGTAHAIGRVSQRIRRLQTGYLYHYAFVMILGFLVLVGWLIL